MSYRWALIDIETTGLNVMRDKIIEIAVLLLTPQGIEASWHQLINPQCVIPAAISRLTGISQAMVDETRPFASIAEELMVLLKDCVLVAHNARFDYGFLKNAFKAEGISFQLPVLCSIALMKQCYPKLPSYRLAALQHHFQLAQAATHRAIDDVMVLYQLLQHAFSDHGTQVVFEKAYALYQRRCFPASLRTDVHQLPDCPGVYVFYGESSSLPLYIGKSITLRQRVLSHFQADHTHSKEFAITQQVVNIEVIPTAGEISALLLESALVKEKMPLYNRKLRRCKKVAGFRQDKINGYTELRIAFELVDEDADSSTLHGAFRSQTAAKQALLQLIKAHKLCPRRCGIEKGKGACFSYQLKQCAGACIGEEPAEAYNLRVTQAMQQFSRDSWPFNGAIAIYENNEAHQISQYIVFNQWRVLGSTANKEELMTLTHKPLPADDYDTYRILTQALKKIPAAQIVQLACETPKLA